MTSTGAQATLDQPGRGSPPRRRAPRRPRLVAPLNLDSRGGLAADTLEEVTAAAERGIHRIRSTQHLAYSFLRRCGLSLR